MKTIIAFLACVLTCLVQAEKIDNVYFFNRKDAITDANKSSLVLPEVNDTIGSTAIFFYCGKVFPNLEIHTKNLLYSQKDYDSGILPKATYRIDSNLPIDINFEALYKNGVRDYTMVAVPDIFAISMYRDLLMAKNKVAIRIYRPNLPELTYTFSAKGVLKAHDRIRKCK